MLRISIVLTVMLTLVGCGQPHRTITTVPSPIFDTRAQAQSVKRKPTPLPKPETPVKTAHSLAKSTIIIDPGHGGKDPGAPGKGPLPEKMVNLKIATRLASILKERGANVISTRTSDRFISLNARAATADRARADLFVSIHSDASQNSAADGSTVYIARNASRQSQKVAQSIVSSLKQAGIKCRGIDRAGFRVLIGHSRPAVLIECGFLSNLAEAKKLATASYQTKVSSAIADGITNALGE